MTSRRGRDQPTRGQTASQRRRVRNYRQIVEGRTQAMRWGVWSTALFGVLAVLRVLLAVLRDGAFRGRHGVGLLIAAALFALAWLQQRQLRRA